ncbi:hypothetical protein K7H99_13365 [Providencia rettgeri]|uniref:hypothetical protein n=1 Tax=Providencia rettgeri TaxID=587 RepID=UPI001CA65FB5|nr:hypothetical protein [Providencia rettgeri]QZY63223.1 hypothetical protein K7H99_13365 [Providencia rettgeri]
MTIDDIKAVNDAYIANEKIKTIIERANKKADGYQAMKYIFNLMVDDRYVKRHETYIDITLMGYEHSGSFYNALRDIPLFIKYGNEKDVWQHRLFKKLFFYNRVDWMYGKNFVRLHL